GGTIRVISNKSSGQTSFERGAVVDVSGGKQGGNAGFVELSGAHLAMGGSMVGQAAPGYKGGSLLLRSFGLTCDQTYFRDVLTPLVRGGMTNVEAQADHDLTVTANVNLSASGGGTVLDWTLPGGQEGFLRLTAGNDLIVAPNSAIRNGAINGVPAGVA